MSLELTQKLGVELYSEMIGRRLPDNLQILPYDELFRRFVSKIPPKILLHAPETDLLYRYESFEFESVIFDAYGNALSKPRGKARQFVEE